MGTKGFNIFFQDDEEDYLYDAYTLLDFEERIIFCGSEEFLKNITIEDPGDVLSISEEDYDKEQKSLLQLKELKKLNERNGNLLRKCRSCSIKVVDCHKFPWYYQNKLGARKKTQYPNTEHKVVEIKEKSENIIIDLTENEHIIYDNQYDKIIQEEYKKNTEKVKANCDKFTSVENAVGGKVRKQTYKRLSKKVLSFQNESHPKVPRSEVEQSTDLIISTYTRLTDKATQKLKNHIESCANSKNISHNLGNNLLLGSKSFMKNRGNFLKDIKRNEKEAKDNNNNDCDTINDKKKNNKKCNKIKNIYTSEQISKTKIKIKKNSLKSEDIISIQNHYKDIKDKGRNLNAKNREQYDSLKMIEKKNYATNEKQQNHCENKQERILYNSYSYSLSSPVLTKILNEKKKSTSLPNRNIVPDRFHGCNKPLISADRIIPHFHENAFLNNRDILSESNTKCQKRSKRTIHIYETKKNRTTLDSTEAFNTGPLVSQMPNLVNNNTMVNNNEFHKKIHNTNVDISNITENQVTYKLPVNNVILKRSLASLDVVKENVNNIGFMSHSKEIAAQLEKERLLYLLPSSLPDCHIQNIY